MEENLLKIETSLTNLTNIASEIQNIKTDFQQFKQNVTNSISKIENDLKSQDHKVVSFINSVFLSLIHKQKNYDLNDYKSKLINSFNLTLDNKNQLKKHTVPKPPTSKTNTDMFDDN